MRDPYSDDPDLPSWQAVAWCVLAILAFGAFAVTNSYFGIVLFVVFLAVARHLPRFEP
ncbi:MAG: hypothetical protein Q7O66_07275 [Dehalococcoidia bacterium]|nr:hypothetical protein [Dehalococcoidia bacterium]